MKYQLYVVTHTGFYPALVACPPSENHDSFVRLSTCIEELRPGVGVYYRLCLIRLNESESLGDEDIDYLREVQRTLS